jgi:hypothetical protein
MINTNPKSTTKRSLPEPSLTITSINIEGLTSNKEILLTKERTENEED